MRQITLRLSALRLFLCGWPWHREASALGAAPGSAYAIIRSRAAATNITTKFGDHSFRATGITAYLKNDKDACKGRGDGQ